MTRKTTGLIAVLLPFAVVSAQYETPLNTTRETVGWVNGPNYRSTADIIFSCVLTMGLCVWSALHLNIPGAKESTLRKYVRNTGWVCLGILGPELIMFAAYKNYAAARSLQEAMERKSACHRCRAGSLEHTKSFGDCSCGGRTGSITISEQLSEWTMLHGYYATMGGFVFDLDSDSASSILNSESRATRMTITPQGLQLLAACGLAPEIEAREIQDKNKADGLTKAIVILQAGWLVAQSVARLAYQLPVTLLEVNTVGHVICAVFIYGLWWHKPREVTEPTVLKGPWVPALAAYMIMSSDLDDTGRWREWASLKSPLLPELSSLYFEREQRQITPADESVGSIKGFRFSFGDSTNYARKADFGSLSLRRERSLTSTSIKRQKSFHHHLEQGKLEDQKQRARWSLALDAMQAFPHLCCRLEDLQASVDGETQTYQSQVLLQERASNWPTKGSIPAFPGKLIGMALWLASIAFGAVHVAAWNEYFPSKLEKWLWRGSSLYLAWAGSLWLSICFLGAVSRRFDAIWDRCITGRANKAVYVCLIPICVVCGIMYAFARLFLVVESIVSLRQMPPGMYITPDWPEVIPHL